MTAPASRIEVGGAGGYQVVVGSGLLGELAPLLPGVEQVALLHPPSVAVLAEAVVIALAEAGIRGHRIELPDGERAKTLAVAGQCFDRLAELGFTRSDAVLGLGGGATTDLAGWVAASWLRGVRLVQLPTTLAGMVDAAIGGKTGINLAAGKNLVGAFYPPAGVLCDLDALASL
ncbi:MAG: 3-dehydroquinate synthase, partial [Jatrophihabitantaceae bacterium]